MIEKFVHERAPDSGSHMQRGDNGIIKSQEHVTSICGVVSSLSSLCKGNAHLIYTAAMLADGICGVHSVTQVACCHSNRT